MAEMKMIPKREGFFEKLEPLEGKKARKKGSLNFISKKEKVEQQLAILKQRQEQAQAQMRRKEAQLQLLAEEEEEGDGLDFKVKVSMRDYELL